VNIWTERIRTEHGRFCDYLLFEQGSYHRPVCILSKHEAGRLVRELIAADAEYVREMLAEAEAKAK
jgi:hypothetical protein